VQPAAATASALHMTNPTREAERFLAFIFFSFADGSSICACDGGPSWSFANLISFSPKKIE
jgi:hypothetical protein